MKWDGGSWSSSLARYIFILLILQGFTPLRAFENAFDDLARRACTAPNCGSLCCNPLQNCVNGKCKCPTERPYPCGNTCCFPTQDCENGQCVCSSAPTPCGANNCCSRSQVCVNGQCKCPSGTSVC